MALPPELLAEIVSYLDVILLPNVRRVSHSFEGAVKYHILHVILKQLNPRLTFTFSRSGGVPYNDSTWHWWDTYNCGEILNLLLPQYVAEKYPEMLQLRARQQGVVVRATLHPAEGADLSNVLPAEIHLMEKPFELKSVKQQASLRPKDESYTLTYSVSPDHLMDDLHLAVLTIDSFTCSTEAIYKTIISNLFHARLAQIRPKHLQSVVALEAAKLAVDASLGRYIQSFAHVNVNELVFRCRGCRVYGKSWQWMECHIMKRHREDVVERLEFYEGDKGYEPMESIVEWKVKGDQNSVYAVRSHGVFLMQILRFLLPMI
ncbi:hypothetical protein HDV00_000710 [Rhizophlyctis rosea]|nr:hypothetical protein HDV00_000710 [Rhizophlyctis rosea]